MYTQYASDATINVHMRSYIPDDKLTDRFSQHGSIKSIFRVRNIAFIEFEKIESCAQAKVGCHEQNIYWYTYKKNGFGNEVSSRFLKWYTLLVRKKERNFLWI